MPITRVLKIDPLKPQLEILAEAAQILQSGGLVAFPTETVYGLGANAKDPQAVNRIFTAKGRPSTDPLIVHIAEATDLDVVTQDAPDSARILAKKFWPGPLTMVLKRSPQIAANVSGMLPTVGVRLPAHPIAHLLIKEAGIPVAAPSANLFSHTSPTEASHVLDDLDGRVDIILDGGSCSIGVESTVLNLLTDPPEILRPGGVSLEALRVYLPGVQIHAAKFSQEHEPAPSPGMLLKHYAPHTPLQVVAGTVSAVQAYLENLMKTVSTGSKRIGLLLTNEMADACAVCRTEKIVVVRLGSSEDLEMIASRLFAALRSLDHAGVSLIVAIEPENLSQRRGLAPAIHDRLIRAASGNYISLNDLTF